VFPRTVIAVPLQIQSHPAKFEKEEHDATWGKTRTSYDPKHILRVLAVEVGIGPLVHEWSGDIWIP